MLSYLLNMRVVILDSGDLFLSSLFHTPKLKCLYPYQVASSAVKLEKKLHNNKPSFSE